jgi:hypothetical protein
MNRFHSIPRQMPGIFKKPLSKILPQAWSLAHSVLEDKKMLKQSLHDKPLGVTALWWIQGDQLASTSFTFKLHFLKKVLVFIIGRGPGRC